MAIIYFTNRIVKPILGNMQKGEVKSGRWRYRIRLLTLSIFVGGICAILSGMDDSNVISVLALIAISYATLRTLHRFLEKFVAGKDSSPQTPSSTGGNGQVPNGR